MKAQNLLSILTIVFAFALLIYFYRNGILLEMARSPDLSAVIAIQVVVICAFAVSLTQAARAIINRYAKPILRIGIGMILFSFLSPVTLLCVVLLFDLDANKIFPMRYFDNVMWGDFGIGGVGILVVMIPSFVKLFEYILSTQKR